MRRGSGLGEKFAREKFELCWRKYATKDEIEYLEQIHGGAWAGIYPREGWKDFIGFEPDSENYLEFFLLIYPDGEPYILARFLVPRDENKDIGFLIWNSYEGTPIFQEI
jgi:Protein of unknown function, DUF440